VGIATTTAVGSGARNRPPARGVPSGGTCTTRARCAAIRFRAIAQLARGGNTRFGGRSGYGNCVRRVAALRIGIRVRARGLAVVITTVDVGIGIAVKVGVGVGVGCGRSSGS